MTERLSLSKTLEEMNALTDMGRFPWTVHLGASANIVFSCWLTLYLFGQTEGEIRYLIPFALILIGLNLLPVILLRRYDASERPSPAIEEMSFFSDQHRFATWVYAVASANMFFWIAFAWWLAAIFGVSDVALPLYLGAFLITYVPLWRVLFRKNSAHVSSGNSD